MSGTSRVRLAASSPSSVERPAARRDGLDAHARPRIQPDAELRVIEAHAGVVDVDRDRRLRRHVEHPAVLVRLAAVEARAGGIAAADDHGLAELAGLGADEQDATSSCSGRPAARAPRRASRWRRQSARRTSMGVVVVARGSGRKAYDADDARHAEIDARERDGVVRTGPCSVKSHASPTRTAPRDSNITDIRPLAVPAASRIGSTGWPALTA